MKHRSSFESKVLTSYAVAALVVAGLLLATLKLAADATDASRWVSHTYEVLRGLADIKASTVQIELNTQNFRISGDPNFLSQRDATIALREAGLERLKQLTADNPRQQERWQGLREVLNERIAISRRVQALRKSQGIEAANAYIATAPLQETRERTYRLMGEMEKEENLLLEQRNAARRHTLEIVTNASGVAALSLFLLLGASYLLIRRQLLDAEASHRALSESEEKLSTTLRSIGDAVLATDARGCITQMNPVAENLTGWDLRKAYGRPVEEVFVIINERTRAPADIPVGKVLATGLRQDLTNDTALIARDGSEHPIADSAAPIRDDQGTIQGVVLVFRDVSVERQAKRMILEQNELLERRVEERTAQLRESEDHLRSVIHNVPALIAYVDAQQRYVYVNEQYRQRFAPNRSDIAGCTVREILGEERYAIAAPLIAKVLRGEPQSYDWQPFPDVWQVIGYAPKRDADGRVTGYYVLGTDITERKHSEARITALNRELEHHVAELEHVSRALRTLSAGNRTMLRAGDEQELLESMCKAIVETGGYDTAVVWYCGDDESKTLRPMAESGYPGGVAALATLKATWADDAYGRGAVGSAIRSQETCVVSDLPNALRYQQWRSELQHATSVIACPLRVDGAVIGALAIYDAEPDAFGRDEGALLTESADDLAYGIAALRARGAQQRNQAAMHRLTHHDALTGLPNETQFTESLTAILAAGKLNDRPFAVLQANIERLSQINDALGFHHGDQLLREFGDRLQSAVPEFAMVARLRGDEFAVLLPDSNAGSALAMVRQLQRELETPFPIADISLEVSAKMGVALFPDHGATVHDLYRHMDIAVRQAKKRDVEHVIFDATMNTAHSRSLTIASELRRAIERGDLLLYLQPKVEIASGRLCGAEALVRWKHAERGLIPPNEFIGLAENTGLIKPLTEWVVETAMLLNREWGELGCPLPIAVNLSARNLRDEHLLERIRNLRAAMGITAGLFEIEITESTVMEDAEFALQVLHKLRDEGIRLYIDDFGTGYSSLAYLQKLPVEYIKIDQSFIRNMAVRKDSERIVHSTIDLIRDLGRKSVAEGIEDQATWNLLAALGCDLGQGYFVARPMPSEDFQEWVTGYRPLTITNPPSMAG